MYMYMKIFANHQHIYRKKNIQIYSDIAKNKHGHSVFGVDDMGSIISSLFCLVLKHTNCSLVVSPGVSDQCPEGGQGGSDPEVHLHRGQT